VRTPRDMSDSSDLSVFVRLAWSGAYEHGRLH
jgi:hypothetical protein